MSTGLAIALTRIMEEQYRRTLKRRGGKAPRLWTYIQGKTIQAYFWS